MNYLKKLGKTLLITIGIIIVLTFLTTVFSYFNVFNDKITSALQMLIPIASLFVGGFKIGKYSKNKGWLEGIKIGIVFIIIMLLINIIISNKIELKSILYYLILLSSSMFGSIIGINKNIKPN